MIPLVFYQVAGLESSGFSAMPLLYLRISLRLKWICRILFSNSWNIASIGTVNVIHTDIDGNLVGNAYIDLEPVPEVLTCLLLYTDALEGGSTVEHILLLKPTVPSARMYERKGIAEVWQPKGALP